MTLPSWRDKGRGSKIRVALWLMSEVGQGGVFTKAQMREAFPDVAQIDRRMRDLREHDWVIHTRRDDPSLKQDEQRFVRRGAEIWIPGQAKSAKEKVLVTGTQRVKVLSADNYLCRTCGIGAGESYGLGGTDAQLDIARRKVRMPDGSMKVQLVTECSRCRVGGSARELDLAKLTSAVESLSPLEKRVFTEWIDNDRRPPSELEKLWGQYRALPEESREAVRRAAAAQDK